jgi:adenylate cyclase
VLEGSVRKADGQVRINVQLIDAKTGDHLWAETFDREYKNIFALQDDIAAQIVAALEVNIANREKQSLSTKSKTNPEAYNLYLKAKSAYHLLTPDGLKEALTNYQAALDIDPTFADAYAGDAQASAFIWRHSFGQVLKGGEARSRAERSLNRALSFDPDNSTALLTKSYILAVDGKKDESVAVARKVVEFSDNPSSRIALAYALMLSGKLEEALVEVDAARKLDPKPSTVDAAVAGYAFHANRMFDDAVGVFSYILEHSPTSYAGLVGLVASYGQVRDNENSKKSVAELLKVLPIFNVQMENVHISDSGSGAKALWLDGLRNAGVPEWPFGFSADGLVRLTGDEIRALLYGHGTEGSAKRLGKFSAAYGDDGAITLHFGDQVFNGQMSIEDDMNCVKSPDNAMGRKRCRPVYRNPNVSVVI